MIDLILKKPVIKRFRLKRPVTVKRSADKPLKSAIKAVSWRIVGTLDTMIISYILTGKINVAVSIGGIEVISKTMLYFLHERLWSRIHNFKIKRTGVKIKREVWN